MTIELPKLSVYPEATSLADLARDMGAAIQDMVNGGVEHYGSKKLLIGDTMGRLKGARMRLGEYAPYAKEIAQTVDIINMRGVHTLQHSFAIGCSTQTRDSVNEDGQVSPMIMGTIDWEQVGDNLSHVVCMAVIENPIKSESPVMAVNIGPAAFGLFMMNKNVGIKLNRAPIPNTKDLDIDFGALNREEYNQIKARNSQPYALKTVANTVFKGRPSCSFLLRHALNLDMSFDDTVEYIKKTKTSDFGIMTISGTQPGQSVTLEKRMSEVSVVSGYEATTNHWNPNGDFADYPSLPRTLNSQNRAEAMGDLSRSSIFSGDYFAFANDGVVDDTTRIIMEMCPATGRMSVVTSHGGEITSKAVTGRFDGQRVHNVEHFTP